MIEPLALGLATALAFGGFFCLALAQGSRRRADGAGPRLSLAPVRWQPFAFDLLGVLMLAGSSGAALWGAIGGPLSNAWSWAVAAMGNAVALAASLAWQARWHRWSCRCGSDRPPRLGCAKERRCETAEHNLFETTDIGEA